MHVPIPKYLALPWEKMSHYGQYHHVDNIFRQSYDLCRSLPFSSVLSDPIKDPLILYELNPFEWINEYPYIVDHYGLLFRFYSSRPLIGVKSLYGIYVGDQILVVHIEFNKITSQI